MPFTPPDSAHSPERILAFGTAGAGKSTAWLDIADAMHKSRTPGMFYVIDTDRTTERMLDEGYSHLEGRVRWWDCFEWDDYVHARDQIVPLATRGDWVVIDMMSYPWQAVRDWFIENVYEQDPQEYFLRTRQMIEEASKEHKGHERQFGGSSGMDWDYITKIYLAWEKSLTVRTTAHVFGATPATELNRNASAEDLKLYTATGNFKPYGQKHLDHRFHTVVMMKRTKNGFEATVAKDRGREGRWEEYGGRGKTIEVGKFSSSYLRKIARWERTRRER